MSDGAPLFSSHPGPSMDYTSGPGGIRTDAKQVFEAEDSTDDGPAHLYYGTGLFVGRAFCGYERRWVAKRVKAEFDTLGHLLTWTLNPLCPECADELALYFGLEDRHELAEKMGLGETVAWSLK